MIKVGEKAPDFKLVDKDKNVVTLENFKGKNLILFFFPMAWTGACTKEMCAVRDDYKAYESLHANIAGVSCDSHFALNKFAAENNIQYPLLSDYNKETIKTYDIVQPEFAGVYKDVAKRATFVIDKNGIVRYIQILQNIADFPDMDSIRNELKKITDVPVS